MRVKFVFENVIGIRFFERRERKFRGLFYSREKLRNCRGRKLCEIYFELEKLEKSYSDRNYRVIKEKIIP